MSVQNSIIRNSGRAIANGVSMLGVKLVDDMVISKHGVNKKELILDSVVLGGTTLLSGTVNSMLTNMVTLPSWIYSIEASYGLDLINLLLYVITIKIIDMKAYGNTKSFVKVVLEAVSALVLGSYVVGPLNTLLPVSMKA